MSDDTYLYFACGWVIRPDVDYVKLRQYADDAEADLVAINPIHTSEQGYAVMTFAVRVLDEPALVRFIETAGVDMGLTHWYGVTAEYWRQGYKFDTEIMTPYFRDKWLAGMQAYGHYNQRVRNPDEN